MALKVLGQSSPAAGTLTTLYTVPAAVAAAVSSIAVCNRGAFPATFRVSVAVGGAVDAVAQYIFYDVTVPANMTYIATIGVTLATTDVLRVLSNSGLVSFSAFGDES